MDPASGLCIGCLRTLDEIAAWSRLDAEGRESVWQRLDARCAARPEATDRAGSTQRPWHGNAPPSEG